MLEIYLDNVFARSAEATLLLAVLYTLLGFFAMYVTVAGVAWLLMRGAGPENVINTRPLRPGQVRYEIVSSSMSILIFALLGGVTFVLLRYGWLAVEGAVPLYRWCAEVIVLFFWNEVHFYVIHRMLHGKWLYTKVHIEHHKTVVVTPFAVYRFHWLEAFLLGMVMPLAMLFHTFSIWTLAMLPPLSILWNVIGHSNYRPLIRGLGWMAQASERHAAHHAKMKGNFGFSLPLFDKWFGTSL